MSLVREPESKLSFSLQILHIYISPVIPTFITGDESWMYGYDPETLIFLKLKSGESTKHYLTQMPPSDAIDTRKKFTHGYVGSRSPHANALH